ncbi:MAG: class I SAM-dependent methyltransferase [Haloferacaceae archaeon]
MRDGVAAAQSFYTRWARAYDVLARHAPGVTALRERAVGALAPERGDAVVEMGCGTGANLPHLRDRVGPDGTVVGVDFAPGALTVARRRTAAWPNVQVVRGDAARPPVAAADRVLATFVVGMLPDPAAAVRDWAALAAPGGRVALLDLARTTRPLARPLNPLFRALACAFAPPGTGARHDSPSRTLDRRVAAAHRAALDATDPDERSTHALGFARLVAGRVRDD